MQSKNFVGRGTKDIKSSLEKIQNEESILCGSFRSTFSNLGSTYFLWRHANFDAAETLRMIWLSNQGTYICTQFSRSYYPFHFNFQKNSNTCLCILDTNLEDIDTFEVKGLVPMKISPMQ